MAEQHLEERLGNGETASVLTSLRSQETSPQSPVMSKKSSNVEQKQKEAKELSLHVSICSFLVLINS